MEGRWANRLVYLTTLVAFLNVETCQGQYGYDIIGCPPGWEFNYYQQRCIPALTLWPSPEGRGMMYSSTRCPPGYRWKRRSRVCAPMWVFGRGEMDCPPGKKWSRFLNRCVPNSPPPPQSPIMGNCAFLLC